MLEGTPEYVWPCATVVVFTALLMLPMFWFHSAEVSPEGVRRPGSAIWHALGVLVTGGLVVLASGVTAIWLIPAIGFRFWGLLFGVICVSPILIAVTWLAWTILWPQSRAAYRRHAPLVKERQLTIGQLMIALVILALFMGGVRLMYETPDASRFVVVAVSFLIALYAIGGTLLIRISDDRLFDKAWPKNPIDAEEDDPPREV